MRRRYVIRLVTGLYLVVGAACGIPLAPGAVYCGTELGIRTYAEPAACPEAMAVVTRARDVGATWGTWAADQHWSNYELQLVDGTSLAAVGHPEASGYTATPSHLIAIIDGNGADQAMGSALHELLHATYGETDHCHWASRYGPMFKALGHLGVFVDECEGLTCDSTGCR